MTIGTYEANLKRALSKMPDYETSDIRFAIPTPELLPEGKTSVLKNFAQIADILNRDPAHIMKFLLKEMGTAGKIDGGRAIFQGRFTARALLETLEAYVDEFVLCSECGRPDTSITRTERVLMMKCDACGAHRPVRKRASRTS